MQSLAPSEFFEGIKFNYSFYSTGDTKVTLEYVNNNFLKCTGYAYSRTISTSFNGIIYALGGIETTDIIATGTITSNLSKGSGLELTNLNASNISDETLAVGRGGTGLSTLAFGQLLIGNDTNPIIQSSKLVWDIQNNNLGIGENPASKLDVNGTVSATLFSGNGSSLTNISADTAAIVIQGDSATNADVAAVDVRLQTARTISGVSFDGSDSIDIPYGNLTNKPQDQLWDFSSASGAVGKYTYNNVGIGSLPSSSYMLYIYDDMNANMRLESSSEYGATTSIEFRKGTYNNVWNDYKIINDNGEFKLQFENASFSYGSAVNDIVKFHSTGITNCKPVRFDDNVGIGMEASTIHKLDILGNARITGNIGISTTSHETYKIDAVGTINATNYAIAGLDILDAGTKKILPARIDMAVVDLNVNKLYERFNSTNFAIVDDKIDFPASYSINITGYDSPTLYTPNDQRRLKDKMNVSYDDRCAKDFYLYDGFKYYMSVFLIKRPSNQPFSHYEPDIISTLLFEWKSSDGLEGRLPAYVMDFRQNPDKSYPFTTIMSFVVEAGFSYYLWKIWYQTEVSAGGTIYIDGKGYGDDDDDFNRYYGAGQTFKLRSDYVFTPNDYTPRTYTAALPGLALQNTPGVVKPRRGWR